MHRRLSIMAFEETNVEPTIFLVVPVYNHGATLRGVVVGALEVNRNVIVVDDGSTDGGSETLAGLPITLIRHSENRGKGTAIMTAARAAHSLGATHIVTIDADGQHKPSEFLRFIPLIKENLDAIVVGTRFFDPVTTPMLSRFGRVFSNFWLRVQTGYKLKDTQSGFRAYPISILQWLKLREHHYDFEVEVVVRAVWAGIPLKEVDISVYYPPRSLRVSHFSLFADNLRLTLLNTRLTMRAMIPFPHKKFLDNPEGAEKITILRPLRSLNILLTGNNSPEQLAVAGGLGVFLGALPLIACQNIITLFAANYFRLNKLMALAAGQICIPPLVPALCIEVGYFMRHGRFLTEVSLETLGYQALERLFEWFLGSLILGPLLGIIAGLVIYVTALCLKRAGRGAN
jgi:glycosyltransferase involved in cell wall biosynthesis